VFLEKWAKKEVGVMIKAKIVYVAVILLMMVAVYQVSATELKGSMWVKKSKLPSGAVLQVTCGKWTGKANFSKSGAYSLRGIPSNRSCTLRVKFPSALSGPIPFSTRKSVVRVDAEIKSVKNALIILRR
jgi:hypothetical protein